MDPFNFNLVGKRYQKFQGEENHRLRRYLQFGKRLGNLVNNFLKILSLERFAVGRQGKERKLCWWPLLWWRTWVWKTDLLSIYLFLICSLENSIWKDSKLISVFKERKQKGFELLDSVIFSKYILLQYNRLEYLRN